MVETNEKNRLIEHTVYEGILTHNREWTGDEESRRNLGGRSSALMRDPRYRGTMDGHPKHDVDNERWR